MKNEYDFALNEFETCTSKVLELREKMDKLEDEFSKAKNEVEHVLAKLTNAKSKLILLNVDTSDFSYKISIDFSALQPKVVQIMKQQQQQQQMSKPAAMWQQQTSPQSKAM